MFKVESAIRKVFLCLTYLVGFILLDYTVSIASCHCLVRIEHTLQPLNHGEPQNVIGTYSVYVADICYIYRCSCGVHALLLSGQLRQMFSKINIGGLMHPALSQ